MENLKNESIEEKKIEAEKKEVEPKLQKNGDKKRRQSLVLSLKKLEQIKKDEQVVDMYVKEVDDSFNMIGVIGNNIKAIVPREEASSIVGEDGLVDKKHIVNKKGKRLQVCIKDIYKNEKDGSIEVIVSKKKLELKVRRWMYMHLQVGMKLKGIVVSLSDYAAFVDVGGGVTGILKLQDMTDVILQNAGDMFRIGQRIEVVVKKYDRDTGRIELSYKELLGSFEDNVKNLHEGDIVNGIIRGRIKTGVFVEIKPNLVGLAEHVNGVEYGQKVLVSIRRIIPEKKKIKLVIIG